MRVPDHKWDHGASIIFILSNIVPARYVFLRLKTLLKGNRFQLAELKGTAMVALQKVTGNVPHSELTVVIWLLTEMRDRESISNLANSKPH